MSIKRKDAEQMAVVMLAYHRGEKIQRKRLRPLHHESANDWTDTENPSWNWTFFNYRIKPPEPREFYMLTYKDGSMPDYVMSNREHVERMVADAYCRAIGYITLREVIEE